jgi:outer membrane protein TolC
VKAAKQSRRQIEAQQEQTRLQIAQQVAQARADLDVAMQAAASYKKEILDPSVTLLSMAKLGYEQGATGILPVIDAESTIRNARVGYINALLALYKAQDEVLAATGTRPSGATAPASNGIKP